MTVIKNGYKRILKTEFADYNANAMDKIMLLIPDSNMTDYVTDYYEDTDPLYCWVRAEENLWNADESLRNSFVLECTCNENPCVCEYTTCESLGMIKPEVVL
jgi:hypothetical protein